MRILLVEDEKELSRALAKMLMKEGYDVDTVYDGADGLNFALSGLYDLIVLDILMPKKNGLEVLQEIRHRGLETPVLMLTALGENKDKVTGLDKGADDYLAKPFNYEELSARIRALLRRRGQLVQDNRLVYSNTALDLSAYTLSTEEKSISLTSKEFELLRYLFEYPNFVASKEDLILKAWGLDSDFESNNLEVYISFIRKKLVHVGADFSIEAVRGVGYRLAKHSL